MQKHTKNTKGQTILEYISLVGIVVLVIVAMSTHIRRSIQGMVRMVSDQMGNQQKSEQAFDETGHLVNSITTAGIVTDKEKRERPGTVSYIFNDRTD